MQNIISADTIRIAFESGVYAPPSVSRPEFVLIYLPLCTNYPTAEMLRIVELFVATNCWFESHRIGFDRIRSELFSAVNRCGTIPSAQSLAMRKHEQISGWL